MKLLYKLTMILVFLGGGLYGYAMGTGAIVTCQKMLTKDVATGELKRFTPEQVEACEEANAHQPIALALICSLAALLLYYLVILIGKKIFSFVVVKLNKRKK